MSKFKVKIKGVLRFQDEFLIVNKWISDNIEEQYQWSFFDVDLEAESSPEEQCLNYIEECTGIHAHVVSIPYTWTYSLGDKNCLGIVFLCETENDIVFLSEELQDYKWVKASELKKYITKSGVLKDLEKAGII